MEYTAGAIDWLTLFVVSVYRKIEADRAVQLACLLAFIVWAQSRFTARAWKAVPLYTGSQLAAAGLGPADTAPTAPAAATAGGQAVLPLVPKSILSSGARLYLDGIRRTLLGLPYLEVSTQSLVHDVSGHTRVLSPGAPFDLAARYNGTDFSFNTLSMVGWRRLASLQACIEDVVARGVPGDLIETGVFRGGGALLMRACLAVTDEHDTVGSGHPKRGAAVDRSRPRLPNGAYARRVFAADSFRGPGADDHGKEPTNPVLSGTISLILSCIASFPVSDRAAVHTLAAIGSCTDAIKALCCPRRADKPAGAFPPSNRPLTAEAVEVIRAFLRAAPLLANLSYYVPSVGAGIESVTSHFARLGLPIDDGRTVLLKGYFDETLPSAPFQQLAVLRLDGDT